MPAPEIIQLLSTESLVYQLYGFTPEDTKIIEGE